jgi:hypothetical protein
MPKQRLLHLLLGAVVLLAVLALVTALPFSSNTNKSDLGYSTLCPFAPWSTLALLIPAGLLWVVRSYVKTQ